MPRRKAVINPFVKDAKEKTSSEAYLRLTLFILLIVMIATRWPSIPKVPLIITANILWLLTAYLVIGRKFVIITLPIIAIFLTIALPYKWLAVPDLPILIRLIIGIGAASLIFLVASLISNRYAR